MAQYSAQASHKNAMRCRWKSWCTGVILARQALGAQPAHLQQVLDAVPEHGQHQCGPAQRGAPGKVPVRNLANNTEARGVPLMASATSLPAMPVSAMP